MVRLALHLALIIGLTALTQIGGLAWALALWLKHRLSHRLAAFTVIYAALWIGAVTLAPLAGRVPLPCRGEPLRLQSPAYCLMLRHFVTPELAAVATEAARVIAADYPGTVTLALDGGFPFLNGMPLLPHLSHHDGEKLDLAFFYTQDGAYLPGRTRSPIGYFAFETLDRPNCPPAFPTLRWDLAWLQPLWPDRPLEPARTRALIQTLLDDPRLGRLFIEPPLAQALGVAGGKLGFQGCRAARHDDHIHIQL
jgi:hypothetical protein